MSPRMMLILSSIGALMFGISVWMLCELILASERQTGYAGFGCGGLTNAQVLAIGRGQGILIHEVIPKSPADLAGLRVGDLIVAADEQSTTSRKVFDGIRMRWRRGDKVTLDVLPVTARSGSAESGSPSKPTPMKVELTLISLEELQPLQAESTVDE